MCLLKKFYSKTLKYDLINKFFWKKTKDLPKLKKIVLNFGSKKSDIKKLAASLLAFELISNQKGILTKTVKPNILLKVRKGNPTGCKVTLQNQSLFNFLGRMTLEIFPKLKTFNKFKITRNLNQGIFSYKISETFSFSELEDHYYIFSNLPELDVTIVTTVTSRKELIFFLSSFQFPFEN